MVLWCQPHVHEPATQCSPPPFLTRGHQIHPNRYATVSWQDEQDIRSGKKVGTMWGIMTKEEAARVKPEEGTKPHMKDRADEEEGDEEAPLRIKPFGGKGSAQSVLAAA